MFYSLVLQALLILECLTGIKCIHFYSKSPTIHVNIQYSDLSNHRCESFRTSFSQPDSEPIHLHEWEQFQDNSKRYYQWKVAISCSFIFLHPGDFFLVSVSFYSKGPKLMHGIKMMLQQWRRTHLFIIKICNIWREPKQQQCSPENETMTWKIHLTKAAQGSTVNKNSVWLLFFSERTT